MSLPRLALLALPVALGVPLLTGACGAPLVVAGASYGADGVSLVETGKTSTDHFASMVSKKDCALWRFFRNQDICREQEGNKNPYDVNYNEPFRQAGESGFEYAPAPHSPADAPAASWDSAAYNSAPPGPPSELAGATVQAEPPALPVAPLAPQMAQAEPTAPPVLHAKLPAPPKKTKKAKVGHGHSASPAKPIKKPAPGPAASRP